MFKSYKAAVWSVPAGVLDAAAVRLSSNILDLYSDIGAAAVGGAGVAANPSECVFFRVQDAYPESKRYIRASHSQDSSQHIVVAMLQVEQVGDCLTVTASPVPNAVRRIDLQLLCQIATLTSILHWPLIEGLASTAAIGLKAPARAMLRDALDIAYPLDLAAAHDVAAIVPVGIADSPLSRAVQSLQRLCDENAWAHLDSFCAWDPLDDMGLHLTALEAVLAISIAITIAALSNATCSIE